MAVRRNGVPSIQADGESIDHAARQRPSTGEGDIERPQVLVIIFECQPPDLSFPAGIGGRQGASHSSAWVGIIQQIIVLQVLVVSSRQAT